MDQRVSTRTRLGAFELHLATGELNPLVQTDGNGKVLLREQPFQILKMLIQREGKIVTRDEIQKALWPNDTIVNFDHSINVAIGILRRALGDSAENPRYIETVARRGYRLLAETESLLTAAGTPPGEDGSTRGLTISDGIVGKKVSHYRVLEVIGGGGMGMVYRAEDLKLGRRVALKFLPQELANDPIVLRRFEREAQTASALNHPNICTIYEIEEHEGQPFIVMELLEGKSLRELLDISPSKVIPVPQLFEIALQICDGLQAAHEKGIIHRDIKPANIFITDQGPAKILDFGLAKLAEHEVVAATAPASENENHSLRETQLTDGPIPTDAALTLAGAAMGTVGYMSPEQVRKEKLDRTTDLFSFGLVLLESATGYRAFTGITAAGVRDAIHRGSPGSAHRLSRAYPRRFEPVICRALQEDRTRRFGSATEMRRALERVRTEAHSAQRRNIALIVAGILLLIGLLGVWIERRSHPPIKLSRSDTIVLSVVNGTKDPVFDDAVYTAEFFDLQQTPYIHVLETDKLREALWELHIPDNAPRTPQVGRQVCLRTNSKMVIATSISEAGNGFRIEMQGINCQTGGTVARASQDAVSRVQVIHALGLATTQLRAKLGEPEASISRFNKPLDEAMSASPEAIQLLTDGYRKTLAGSSSNAISDYQRAVALDPNFAMALTVLGVSQANMGERVLATVPLTKAFGLRDRVTEPVRLQIEDHYYDNVTGQMDKAYSVLTEWVRLFPDDFIAHNDFARCLLLLGKQDQSLAEAREAARLFPSPWSYGNVISRDILTDRLSEATAVFRELDARKFDDSHLRESRALVAFLEGNAPELERQWSWAATQPAGEHLLLNVKGLVEGYAGRDRNFILLSTQAIDMAQKEGDPSDAAAYIDQMALEQAEMGNLEQARLQLRKALGMSQDSDSQMILALALARAGEIGQAQTLIDKINREAPLDTIIQNYSLPVIRASMKLEANDASGAIEALRPALKYDLAYPRNIGGLYAAYVRGQAYLKLGEGHLASIEFQKLIDRPGMVEFDVIGALSRLQMARAQSLAGDKVAALKSYTDFLVLWKDADLDLPVYLQAKNEYAKLTEPSGSRRN